MRFVLDDEQRGFARSLDDLLAGSDTPSVARAWAKGDQDAGLRLWSRLADLGVNALLVPEDADGLGAAPVEMVVAFEALGRHAVPGPWVETAAFLAACAVPGVAMGEPLTVAMPPHTPRALDADIARTVYMVGDGLLHEASVGERHESVDPTRRLFELSPVGEPIDADLDRAFDLASLACAAQLLGLGEHLLEASVDYVKQRKQFGRSIGSYQAIKHALADVRIGLDFARPLVYGAAVAPEKRAVSAAKVGASDAAYRAARTALQVHGAIGYTAEHDLGLWLLKVRALVGAWGTAAFHRDRILHRLVEPVETVER
jgi:alkylation response protein AidB-like acyl-CoA dehydrogenase